MPTFPPRTLWSPLDVLVPLSGWDAVCSCLLVAFKMKEHILCVFSLVYWIMTNFFFLAVIFRCHVTLTHSIPITQTPSQDNFPCVLLRKWVCSVFECGKVGSVPFSGLLKPVCCSTVFLWALQATSHLQLQHKRENCFWWDLLKRGRLSFGY